jgi:hypothetical protein
LAVSAGPPSLEDERDALRIQAAAVAAQQAALIEEEARLQQRRVALEQQEKQLVAHLEAKRLQLLRLRDEARQARDELRQERQTHEQHVGAVANDLAQERQQLAERQRQARAQRQRLVGLRRYLKHRWHRHWLAERKAQQHREQELVDQRGDLEKGAERLRRAVEELTRARLRWNGERELGRRRLRAARWDLREEQWAWYNRLTRAHQQLQEWARRLDRRAAELVRDREELEEQKRQWARTRLHRELEAEGLESRIRNQRRKIHDQEQEIVRLETVLRSLTQRQAPQAAEAPPPGDEAQVPMALPVEAPPVALLVPRQLGVERLPALERLAEELADQRLHLVEQWERLLAARTHWQQEHDAAAAELEAVALRFQEQELMWAAREEAVAAAEGKARLRLDEVIHLRHNLEGCQARLRSRAVTWEGERDRLQIDLRHREDEVQRRLKAFTELRQRWEKRRRYELNQVKAALATVEKLRQEYAALRDEWLRHTAALEYKERDLAEKTLALEQYRQEVIGHAVDSPAVERRLEGLRRPWAALSAAAEQKLARERQAFQAEIARVDERARGVEKQLAELATRELKLAGSQTAWEHDRLLLHDKYDVARQELQSLHAQRQCSERQLAELREALESVARTLLDENEIAMVPVIVQQAA